MVYSSAQAVNPGFRPQLKWRRDHRRRNDVLLDAANAGDVLSRDAQGPPLLFGAVVGHPDMDDTIPDNDIGRPCANPLLALQLCQELLEDRAVVGGRVGAEATSRRR